MITNISSMWLLLCSMPTKPANQNITETESLSGVTFCKSHFSSRLGKKIKRFPSTSNFLRFSVHISVGTISTACFFFPAILKTNKQRRWMDGSLILFSIYIIVLRFTAKSSRSLICIKLILYRLTLIETKILLGPSSRVLRARDLIVVVAQSWGT